MNRPTLAGLPPVNTQETQPPPYDEPINITKLIRIKFGYGINSFADYAEVKPQTVLRTDQGTYRKIPASILTALMELEPQYRPSTLQNEYRLFVEEHRKWAWLQWPLPVGEFFEPDSRHPLLVWREYIGLTSRMGFCTRFCLHPSTLRRFEQGLTRTTPAQIVELFEDVLTFEGSAEIVAQRLDRLVRSWKRTQIEAKNVEAPNVEAAG